MPNPPSTNQVDIKLLPLEALFALDGETQQPLIFNLLTDDKKADTVIDTLSHFNLEDTDRFYWLLTNKDALYSGCLLESLLRRDKIANVLMGNLAKHYSKLSHPTKNAILEQLTHKNGQDNTSLLGDLLRRVPLALNTVSLLTTNTLFLDARVINSLSETVRLSGKVEKKQYTLQLLFQNPVIRDTLSHALTTLLQWSQGDKRTDKLINAINLSLLEQNTTLLQSLLFNPKDKSLNGLWLLEAYHKLDLTLQKRLIEVLTKYRTTDSPILIALMKDKHAGPTTWRFLEKSRLLDDPSIFATLSDAQYFKGEEKSEHCFDYLNLIENAAVCQWLYSHYSVLPNALKKAFVGKLLSTNTPQKPALFLLLRNRPHSTFLFLKDTGLLANKNVINILTSTMLETEIAHPRKQQKSGLYYVSEDKDTAQLCLSWLIEENILDNPIYQEKIVTALTTLFINETVYPYQNISPLTFLLRSLFSSPEADSLLAHPSLQAHPRYINYLFDILETDSIDDERHACLKKRVIGLIQAAIQNKEQQHDLNTLTASGLPLIVVALKSQDASLVNMLYQNGVDLTQPYHWSRLYYHVLFSSLNLFLSKKSEEIRFAIPDTLLSIKEREHNKLSARKRIELFEGKAGFYQLPLPIEAQEKSTSSTERFLSLTHGHFFSRGSMINRYHFLQPLQTPGEALQRRLSEINRRVMATLAFGEQNTATRLFDTQYTSEVMCSNHYPLYEVKTTSGETQRLATHYYDDAFYPADNFCKKILLENARFLSKFFIAQEGSHYKTGNCETHEAYALMSVLYHPNLNEIHTAASIIQRDNHGQNHFYLILNGGFEHEYPDYKSLPQEALLMDPYLNIVATKEEIESKYHSNYFGDLEQKQIYRQLNERSTLNKLDSLRVQACLFSAYSETIANPPEKIDLIFAETFITNALKDKTQPNYDKIKKTISAIRLIEEKMSYDYIFNAEYPHPFVYAEHTPFSHDVKKAYWALLTPASINPGESFHLDEHQLYQLNSNLAVTKLRTLLIHIHRIKAEPNEAEILKQRQALLNFIDVSALQKLITQLDASPTTYFGRYGPSHKAYCELRDEVSTWITKSSPSPTMPAQIPSALSRNSKGPNLLENASPSPPHPYSILGFLSYFSLYKQTTNPQQKTQLGVAIQVNTDNK